jgi:hypothetical protein
MIVTAVASSIEIVKVWYTNITIFIPNLLFTWDLLLASRTTQITRTL